MAAAETLHSTIHAKRCIYIEFNSVCVDFATGRSIRNGYFQIIIIYHTRECVNCLYVCVVNASSYRRVSRDTYVWAPHVDYYTFQPASAAQIVL